MTAKTVMAAVVAGGFALVACSPGRGGGNEAMEGNGVSIRNLTETNVASPAEGRQLRVEGTLIPTPSDTKSRHFLLRERQAVGGTIVAILREESGGRLAYTRAEVDCGRRLFHVVGTAPSRAQVEVATAADGPLRPMTGKPLREEIAAFVCERAGTPLKPA